MNPLWYDVTYSQSFLSACAGIPALQLQLQPNTVVDVGGGHGAWAKAWEALYPWIAATVVDKHDVPYRMRHSRFTPHDLTVLRTDWPSYGVAVCLEVGEHLPLEHSATLVGNLAQMADSIVFSAAQPGQEGPGHVNLQTPEWWAGLFSEASYDADHEWPRALWGAIAPQMEPWYRENVTLYTKKP